MKIVNLLMMLLMAALTAHEGWDIMQHGAQPSNVIFCLIFLTYTVRRAALIKRYS